MDPTTAKEKKVLAEADATEEGDRLTIHDVRTVYDRGNGADKRAVKNLREKGVIATTDQPGVFEIVWAPWDDGQLSLDEAIA
ncbi:MAG: hypothetical protein SVU88_03475 [Candidatus Nanohaloarchaea archaeon]|nr:hypothetical protein [Candidatus Nanohaloarchaea archaeon]